MYTDLKSYQNAVIVHDFTVEFIKRYVDRSHTSDMSYKSYSRMADQMIQAAGFVFPAKYFYNTCV